MAKSFSHLLRGLENGLDPSVVEVTRKILVGLDKEKCLDESAVDIYKFDESAAAMQWSALPLFCVVGTECDLRHVHSHPY